MDRIQSFVLAALLAGTFGRAVKGADWPQFRGSNHDGISPEKILTVWPTNGLRQIWKRPLRDGFSGITVADGKVFTLVTREVDGADHEVCLALDANTGNELWAAPVSIARYDGMGNAGTPDNNGGDGPRCTPSYDSGKVYTYSVVMVLTCLDAATGREMWSCDMVKEHAGLQGSQHLWYHCAASPLIEGDLVYIEGGGPGEALLAFSKADGHVVWKGQDDRMTYSTPVAATILGQRQVIFWTQSELVAVTPTNGSVLWRFPTRYSEGSAMSPVVFGDIVYCSAAYGFGSIALQISKTADGYEARQLWSQQGYANNVLQSHWSTPVCSQGYLYGLFGQAKYGRAPLICAELASGRILWQHPGFGPGGCTLVNGQVLVLSDAGDLVLVKADPTAYSETARSHVLAGKCWNCPSVSNGRIYARSTKEGVCLDVSIK